MAKKPPAFQFYASDFSDGTDDYTLTEVGGYIRLLCSQWSKGSIPGDNPNKLAGIMRCTPATAKNVWASISEKFERGDDGRWRNAKLEDVRREQSAFRATKSRDGKKGAETRWHKDAMAIAVPPDSQSQNSNSSSSSSSSTSVIQVPPDPVSAVPQSPTIGRAPLIPRGQAAAWGVRHGDHVTGFCDWMCLPLDLAYQFASRLAESEHLGQPEDALPLVFNWAHDVRARGVIPTGKMYDFWNAQWEATYGSSSPATDGAAGRHARTSQRLNRFVENG
jgi:uncharacterized protein YdaU (DUF1376 family)